MAWTSTTRWIDTLSDSVDDSVNLLMRDNEVLNEDNPPRYSNLIKHQVLNESSEFQVNNQIITYNLVEFSIDYTSGGVGSIESRTRGINGLILVYQVSNQENSSVNYIINRNSDALKYLRLLCNYRGRGEIISDNPHVSSDLFMWFVKKVYFGNNVFNFEINESLEKELRIQDILGVKSETYNESKLSARGDFVMQLISTLSLILESDKLEQIILRTEYTNHETIELRITDEGIVSNDIVSYSGEYEDENSYNLKAKLILLVYLEIIPHFITKYNNEVQLDIWNLNEKERFFQNVQESLINRLEERQRAIF